MSHLARACMGYPSARLNTSRFGNSGSRRRWHAAAVILGIGLVACAVIAKASAFYVFTKYVKLRERNQAKK